MADKILEFNRLELSDAEKIRPLLSGEGRICDSTLGTTLMWRRYFDTHFAFYRDSVIFRVFYAGEKNAFTCPFGPDTEEMLTAVIEYTEENALPLVFCSMDERRAKILGNRFGAEPTTNRDWADYLYPAENFISYSGKSLREKRNHLNQFRASYENWSTEPITDENLPEIHEFFAKYCAEVKKDSAVYMRETEICWEVLSNWKAYGFIGLALRVSGNIVAFTCGECLGDTLYVHIEKAERQIRGAYQVIASEFVKSVQPDVSFVNREDDAADEGLRKSKLSYKPCALLGKYTLKVRTDDNKNK